MTGQTTNAVRLVRSMWPATEPARWSLRRLRHLADIRPSNVDKKSVDGEANVRLCNYTDVYYNDSITSDMSFMPATAPLAQVKRFELRPDDVLVTKDSETPADIAIAAHVRDELPGVLCGYHLAILRPLPHVDGRFLVYALQSRPLAAQTEVAASGVTRFALSTGALADLTLPVPGRAEQLAIADFLDRETAKIDALVAKKQRLVGLLQEKRTALISHAVTKGLDPDVPMKDSGIKWLGEIPAHWQVTPIRRICDVTTGNRDTVDADADGAYPFFVRSQHIERIASYSYDGEAVLTAGDGAGVAKVFHYYCGRFDYHQRVYAFTRFRRVSGKFFYHYLKENFYKVALDGAAKSTVDSLRRPLILDFRVCVPPPDEQIHILSFLEGATARVDALSELVRRAIRRLEEYRSALITAAVTGQIDVRIYRRDPAELVESS